MAHPSYQIRLDNYKLQSVYSYLVLDEKNINNLALSSQILFATRRLILSIISSRQYKPAQAG